MKSIEMFWYENHGYVEEEVNRILEEVKDSVIETMIYEMYENGDAFVDECDKAEMIKDDLVCELDIYINGLPAEEY